MNEKGRFAQRKNYCTPEMLKEICALLSQGYFRTTVRQYLKISPQTWDNWMKNKNVQAEVEHAEACFFKDLQQRWLGEVGTNLSEAKEFAKHRFPAELNPGRGGAADAQGRKVTVIIKKYNAKGVR